VCHKALWRTRRDHGYRLWADVDLLRLLLLLRRRVVSGSAGRLSLVANRRIRSNGRIQSLSFGFGGRSRSVRWRVAGHGDNSFEFSLYSYNTHRVSKKR